MKDRKSTRAKQTTALSLHLPLLIRATVKIWPPFSAACFALALGIAAQSGTVASHARRAAGTEPGTPPRVLEARRFLTRHGAAGRRTAGFSKARAGAMIQSAQSPSANATWEPLGPFQVSSASYGLVTGRISSLELDPADSTANRLIAGTTGGGVWISQNAGTANVPNLTFVPLTDQINVLYGAEDSSISIGAVTIQPGGTGVILAGTGDPNDALDSYYGAGLLRSADGGNTWALIPGTSDVASGLGSVDHGFLGEGFAGFAWSTTNPNLVAAAVSQAYEGELVDADLAGYSYAGLYYSSDSGATWHLAKITDGNGQDIQGPTDAWAGVDGNAATAVVWNPVRNLFVAAVRFHGYYQSSDGITWTRMAAQPGSGLTAAMCPTDTSMTGSPACPIFRGALAVNPLTGDTFAWTVDVNNQDQGLWQDACALSSGACSSQSILFATQWSTAALETSTTQGAVTIANGDYNLALAAVPSGQDTLMLAGANDLWKCSLAMGCQWRNTTNSTTCMSAQVGEYQHAIAWSAANPLEIFVGNDSGLWRSLDAIGETGTACASTDASHWQNLNGALGSLAEVEDMAGVALTPYTLMAGLGANGIAGIKGAAGPQQQWPEILGGEGGPVAIDPVNSDNWYANNGAGVSIHLCVQAGSCTTADFGAQPVVTDADMGDDGLTMTEPAPFLVDPVDSTQLLIATCRLWRGPANGSGWTAGNAITAILGGGSHCGSSPQIRALAAAALPGGGEIVYAGTSGTLDGGGNMAGHVLAVTMNAGGTWSGWHDLTLNPVANDTVAFNAYNLDVSSLTIDPHDATGQTVYATIAGIPDRSLNIRMLYRSTDGGAHWNSLMSNLIYAPANALLVDPVDANTVYLGTDAGVFVTQHVASCAGNGANCWAAYGSGLPEAPVTALLATQPSGNPNVLVAGTYGRGIWQIPLLTAGQQMTSATATPTTLTFADQDEETTSASQSVTLTNTGGIALILTTPAIDGDFVWSDPNSCIGSVINANQQCAIQVTFSPTALGTRSGTLTIQGNIAGGNITVNLSGTGDPPPQVTLSPQSIDFGAVETGNQSATQQITATNRGTAEGISSLTVTGPFAVTGNACGSTLPADGDCEITAQFNPTTSGAATGILTMVDAVGTQTVQLTGTGTAPPTDTLGASSLVFPATIIGVPSAAQKISLSNSGGNPLTSISLSTSGPFQQSNNCTTQLIGGQDCTISMVFIPTAAGNQSGTLTVSDILRTQTVALQGTGVNPPQFTITPPSLDFSATQPGTTSAPQTLTVANSGGASMANIGFQITGSGAAAFATGKTTCGAELDPGSSCIVPVTYAAPPSGILSANLIVSTSTPGSNNSAITATVPLNGAASGALVVQPALVNFPTTGVGQISSAVTITLTNQGTAQSFDNLTLKASAGFQVSNNACPGSLAADANCTVQIAFAPTAAGPQTGTLTISSSTLSSPIPVPLTGTGYDFTASVMGSATQTVSSGETATYTLSLSPDAGVAASFSFQCASLPTAATCSFNPAPLAVAANATGTEMVQIATAPGDAALERRSRMLGAAPAILACGALLFWPLARRRRRIWILMILLLIPALPGGLGCSGSGGGGGGTVQQNNNTGPGSYTLSVTVTSNGVKHTVPLTLVVD
jgi:Abnormal spindle-like microcephaly-assoc'd, ASPM-SPD-2-Hydin